MIFKDLTLFFVQLNDEHFDSSSFASELGLKWDTHVTIWCTLTNGVCATGNWCKIDPQRPVNWRQTESTRANNIIAALEKRKAHRIWTNDTAGPSMKWVKAGARFSLPKRRALCSCLRVVERGRWWWKVRRRCSRENPENRKWCDRGIGKIGAAGWLWCWFARRPPSRAGKWGERLQSDSRDRLVLECYTIGRLRMCLV